MNRHLSDRQISAYLDGRISPDEADLVIRHTGECADCADRLARFALLDRSLAEMESAPVEDAMLQRVRSRVLRETARERRTADVGVFGWLGYVFSPKALTYACVALVLVGGVLFLRNDSRLPDDVDPLTAKLDSTPPPVANQLALQTQQEIYRLATGALSKTAKETLETVSEEGKFIHQGSQDLLATKFADLSQKSSALLTSAKTKASVLTENAEEHGSRVMDAAAKQTVPQAGIAVGMTILQLLGGVV
ncbi:MAG TPA: zf-HC2 domain-containing protein [bacterium]|nr:zf-HC2 domain-containing protein [bacterium]